MEVFGADGEFRAMPTSMLHGYALSGIGVWELDLTTQTLTWSKTTRALFGLSPTDPINYEIFLSLLEPQDKDRTEAAADRAIETLGQYDVEYRVVRPDGSKHWIRARGGVVADAAGTPLYFSGVVLDIDEQKQTAKRLQELQAELIHISRLNAMGEMASALAHELNQPLSAISNYMNGLRRLISETSGPQQANIDKALRKACEQAIRAGEIIRRLRDFVSPDEAEKHPESLSRLVEEAAALGLTGSREQGILFSVELDPAHDMVTVDRVQIQQVLLNLFRNGLEAMAASAIKELTVCNISAADGFVEVAVADTGSGFTDEAYARLFQTFFTTKSSGMGVGLSISRTIIEAHGGRLWAETNSRGGATFRFTLPSASFQDANNAA